MCIRDRCRTGCGVVRHPAVGSHNHSARRRFLVPARRAGVALFLTSGIAAYCYDSDGNERNQKFHRSRHLFGSFRRGGTQKRGLDPTSTAEVLDDPNGRMVEYARAEKQREHQPSFLTVRESVQFSAGRKKPMHFFCLLCRRPMAGRRGKYRNKFATERRSSQLFCTFVIRKII